MVFWLENHLVQWLENHLVFWLENHLVQWLENHLVHRLESQSVQRLDQTMAVSSVMYLVTCLHNFLEPDQRRAHCVLLSQTRPRHQTQFPTMTGPHTSQSLSTASRVRSYAVGRLDCRLRHQPWWTARTACHRCLLRRFRLWCVQGSCRKQLAS